MATRPARKFFTKLAQAFMQRIRHTIDGQYFDTGTGITNKAIWLEDTATMRHIRLALEDNCSSCIRHPNLTLDGGTHCFTPAMQTNFVLFWVVCNGWVLFGSEWLQRAMPRAQPLVRASRCFSRHCRSAPLLRPEA